MKTSVLLPTKRESTNSDPGAVLQQHAAKRELEARAAVALVILIIVALLSACGQTAQPLPPTVTAVDTFCTRVSRFHATDAQRAAMKANRATWESLVNWLGGINEQWDQHCK